MPLRDGFRWVDAGIFGGGGHPKESKVLSHYFACSVTGGMPSVRTVWLSFSPPLRFHIRIYDTDIFMLNTLALHIRWY